MRLTLFALVCFLLLVAWAHQQQTFVASTAAFLGLSTTEQEPWDPSLDADDLPAGAFRPYHSRTFYRLFAPSPSAQASTRVRPVPAHAQLTVACLDDWLARGTWGSACTSLVIREPRVDVVWTWVNGSDPLHAAARAPFDRADGAAGVAKQYREHNELLYSMRSVRAATASWAGSRWHLVTNSYDVPDRSGADDDEELEGKKLGQVPQWMDIDDAEEQGLTFHHGKHVSPRVAKPKLIACMRQTRTFSGPFPHLWTRKCPPKTLPPGAHRPCPPSTGKQAYLHTSSPSSLTRPPPAWPSNPSSRTWTRRSSPTAPSS
jgi:hypothetical protein